MGEPFHSQIVTELRRRHGGKEVSSYISEHLHEIIESVKPEDIPAVVEFTQSHGGYYRRWRGGALQRWTQWNHGNKPGKDEPLTMEERLTLAFLQVRYMFHYSWPQANSRRTRMFLRVSRKRSGAVQQPPSHFCTRSTRQRNHTGVPNAST